MKIKKLLLSFLFVTSLLLLAACGSKTEYYFAQATPNQNSEWVSYVIVEKQGNKITDVKWNAYHIAGDLAGWNYLSKQNYNGKDKYTQSKEGIYMMTSDETTGKKLKWHEQADLLSKKLIETQDYNDRKPVPAGASISSDDFYVLVEKALSSPAVQKGSYVDGFHYISLKDTASDRTVTSYWDPIENKVLSDTFKAYKFGSFVVVNGTIVLAYYNEAYTGYLVDFDADGKAINHVYQEDGKEVKKAIAKVEVSETVTTTTKEIGRETIIDPETNKKTVIVTTETTTETNEVKSILKSKKLTKNQLGLSYLMKKPNGPATYEFFEAAKFAGDYLIENQNLDVAFNTSGKTDAIAGVTITAKDFQTIALKIPKK
ncbi:conserved hypothetical protein [Alteracholeplasma palmae J233]|uniref:Lipoprotein n=1 Tax=Alteracholeplasma palmae (strain ATCC 49389 / J233) TaxID=1318466 RepID=U4KQB1_ALTPJ|nr:hypothetical protein [Alteracholeplasma palmae]CCV64475.1 conserved hypothetical protein [Alteracholeplasma palmae J233]